MYSREELVNILKSGIVRVVFTKANGDERVMMATLVSDYIPQTPVVEGARQVKTQSEESIRVYDTEKSAWRSFRISSVTEIQVNV